MSGLSAGQHVTSKIRLIRRLGKGAMGEVWEAVHLALGTLVAVKFMAPRYADNEQSVVRFQEEAQKTARIKCPHVAVVFDHGVTPEGQPYIAMELLEGETLRKRMERVGPMPVDELVRLVKQTAIGLEAAHKLGVVHRDIKPDNLFVLDSGGEPFIKILDFGIAKQVDASQGLTSTGVPMGTPLYMSPEQFNDTKRIDHRTDLWSLGVVAYEALTGKPPFRGDTIFALYRAVEKGDFVPPSVQRPDLPEAVDAWMNRALSLNVEARFGSAMDMAEGLISVAVRRNAIVPPPRLPETVAVPSPPETVAVPSPAITNFLRPDVIQPDAALPVSHRLAIDIRNARTRGTKLSVVVFKVPVSPVLGEIYATELTEVLEAARRFVRPDVFIGRHGASCLVLILPGAGALTSQKLAKILNEKVRGELDKRDTTKPIASKLYIGAAHLEPTDQSPEDLIARASRPVEDGGLSIPPGSPEDIALAPTEPVLPAKRVLPQRRDSLSSFIQGSSGAEGSSALNKSVGPGMVRGAVLLAVDKALIDDAGPHVREQIVAQLRPPYAEDFINNSINNLVAYDLEALNAYIEIATAISVHEPSHWRTLGRLAIDGELHKLVRSMLRPAPDLQIAIRRGISVWSRLFSFGTWKAGAGQNGKVVLQIAQFDKASLALRLWTVGVVEETVRRAVNYDVRVVITVGETGFTPALVCEIAG